MTSKDVFILSGAEDRVPVTGSYPGRVQYRPRTEGLFARSEHVHDRAGIPPELMNVIQNEIITVISKHVKVDREGIEMKLSHQRGETRLMADIPILSYRSRPTAERKRKTAA